MYQYDEKPGTTISDSGNSFLANIRNSEYAVLVGRNNCGKSYLLKTMTNLWGLKVSYVGPQRYQNFNLLGFFAPNKNRLSDRWNQFSQQWGQQQQNIDHFPINLQQAIAELTDKNRVALIEIMELLLGAKMEIRHTVEGNSMSQQYISVNGHNISYTSSGFRLITTLLTSLLDSDYDTFLIDEPELGISPEAQSVLANFLFDREHRKRYFSHIKTLIFATHSTIFLDRKVISNNYVVTKTGDEIDIHPVESMAALNRVHFFLLGNRMETLFLPSAIVLVEGKCDHQFIERCLTLRFPEAQFSVIPAHGDSRIKDILSVTRGLFSDLQRSPYRDRIFVVLDATHTRTLPQQLKDMGLPAESIVTWPLNGIEYYYPPEIMDQIFGVGGEIEIKGDRIIRNQLDYSKNELTEKVVRLLTASTVMHPDFEDLFMSKLNVAMG